jgi:hypothetical protein
VTNLLAVAITLSLLQKISESELRGNKRTCTPLATAIFVPTVSGQAKVRVRLQQMRGKHMDSAAHEHFVR